MKYQISHTKKSSGPLPYFTEIQDREGYIVAITFGQTEEVSLERAEAMVSSWGLADQLRIAGETIDRYAKELARENEAILVLEGTIEGMQDKINELEGRKERVEYPDDRLNPECQFPTKFEDE